MLSRAKDARVQDLLGSYLPGTIQMYWLEHLAIATKIPAGHAADLAAFSDLTGRRTGASHRGPPSGCAGTDQRIGDRTPPRDLFRASQLPGRSRLPSLRPT